jgi:hypothetical protein
MNRSLRVCIGSLSLLVFAGCPAPASMPDVEEQPDRVAADAVVRDTARVEAGADAESDSGASMDGAMDAAAEGGVEAGASMDAAVEAGSAPDATSSPDVAAIDVTLSDVFLPPEDSRRAEYCDQPSTLRVCTMDSDCDRPVQRCLPTGCGAVQRCQPAGRTCRDNADCLAGSQTCTRGTCVASGPDCGDSRACPTGYACEGAPGARTCVNRRHVCDGTSVPCPYGGVCEGVPGLAPHCVAVTSRCASDDACRLGSSCRDVDGDGLRECVPSGPCTPGACPMGDRCEIRPVDYFLVCGPRGICNATTGCGAGYECVDVWASGVSECRPTTQPCRTNAQCPVGQLCFEAGGGGMPAEPAGCR